MSKTKESVIAVKNIFAGKQTDKQAFMDLILYKQEMAKSRVDYGHTEEYNESYSKTRRTQRNGGHK